MSTYKVIQDIEAEDKIVGPLTLRQFIYAGIAAICAYLSFLAVTKHAAFMLVIFLPVMAFTGFFAFPWGRDQSTEVWALAKLRFALKPRKRIWDQSGTKDLVTVTVPKRVEQNLTNGLSQHEVNSRLRALADTIDSRGWAVKNVNVNMYAQPIETEVSDRLLGASNLPQEVSNVDIKASDDILDESANPVAHHFTDMINASTEARHQQLVTQMQQPAALQPVPQQVNAQQPPNDYWFMQQRAVVPGQASFVNSTVIAPGVASTMAAPALPQAAMPTAEEQAMVEKFKQENAAEDAAYGNMKTVKPMDEQLADEARLHIEQARAAAAAKPVVTPHKQAAIINLAQNDDLDVATIARQANKQAEGDDNEVVISLR